MTFTIEDEVTRLKLESNELFEKGTLNILNGQFMYDEFKEKKLMGDSDIAPFNEAMCVNETTEHVFSDEFDKIRAAGHGDSIDNYRNLVITPLDDLFNKNYQHIVLWFGEDMFCQMNLLTLFAYLEQSSYDGRVFLNSFKEDEFHVAQFELQLGEFSSLYKEVLIKHQKPTEVKLPLLDQAIDIYLDLLQEDNRVTQYIAEHSDLSVEKLLQHLFIHFSAIGYGDTQYLAIIDKVRGGAIMTYAFLEIDHVQLAAPKGSEDIARKFFTGVLGLQEIEKPPLLKKRGGVWFIIGDKQLHIGIEESFTPAIKAHPAFVIDNIEALKEHLKNNDVEFIVDHELPHANRIYINDPFGNRIELLEWEKNDDI